MVIVGIESRIFALQGQILGLGDFTAQARCADFPVPA